MLLTGNSAASTTTRACRTATAIGLDYARDTIIRGNDVRQNKAGISLKASTGNTIESNDASESEGDGIALEALSIDNIAPARTSRA